MTYPSSIATRIPYDLDGSVLMSNSRFLPTYYFSADNEPLFNFAGFAAGITLPAPPQFVSTLAGDGYLPMTGEVPGGGLEFPGFFTIVFPAPRSITGIFLAWGYVTGWPWPYPAPVTQYMWFSVGTGLTISTSPDTLTGDDGTWTVADVLDDCVPDQSFWGLPHDGDPETYGYPQVEYGQLARQYAQPVSGSAFDSIRGLRVTFPSGAALNPRTPWPPNVGGQGPLIKLFLYGTAAPVEDALLFWEVDFDMQAGPSVLDFGDSPRGSSMDRIIRVKNVSRSKTCKNIVLSVPDHSDELGYVSTTSPSLYVVSKDGINFGDTITIPQLSPQTISQPIYIRQITPSTATETGVFSSRIVAAGSWS